MSRLIILCILHDGVDFVFFVLQVKLIELYLLNEINLIYQNNMANTLYFAGTSYSLLMFIFLLIMR